MTTTATTHADLKPPTGRRLRWAFSDAFVLAGRTLKHIPRNPDLLIFATIQPVMFVLLFRYVFGGAIDTGSVSYVNYLMAGIFVQTVMFGSVMTGIGLAEDLQRGLVERFRTLPMAPSAVLTGRTIADLGRNLITVAIMFAVGLAVGFRPAGNPLRWVAAILLLLLVSYAISWIAALIGLMVNSVEAAQSAGFIWMFPLTFASSAFVQTGSMPAWLQTFSKNQPVTHFVDATRALLIDKPLGNSLWLSVLWCAGILAVFVPLAVRRYRHTTSK
jgi:ABC-2 type transport system permease protein/oleandomycin transport system permease protein